MYVERCDIQAIPDWIALRRELWPHVTEPQHHADALAILARAGHAAAFLARTDTLAGLAEVALRTDYVNGCITSPVAFLEGIYVRPDFRLRGVARALCAAAEAWAATLGCSELASDTNLHNATAQHMHRALGFEETERVVFYRKPILPRQGCP